ncbi:MAG: HD domain-containing protein [Dehalococcoidia bacterium]|nr:HD domain-containing protein [Dehalococcoidia bacterium]
MATRESLIAGPLAPFMEARAAAAARAFARNGGVFAPHEACTALADVLDSGLRGLVDQAEAHDVAVVAVGGYGRREQFRHSDIDLMLLVPGTDTTRARAVLYPLWDADLKVGHSIRTVDQALEAARGNLETMTALLTARLVGGDQGLYDRWQRAFAKLVRGRLGWLRGALAEQYRELVTREPWQLQEFDLKGGRGGLRTFQGARWLELAEALADGTSPPTPPPEVARALDVISSGRHALHALSDRRNDRYLRDLAQDVAGWLGVQRVAFERALLQAGRDVDAYASSRLSEVSAGRGGLGGILSRLRGTSTARAAGSPPAGTSMGGTDLEMLYGALERVGPASLDPFPASPWLTRLLPEWDVLRCLPHVAPFHRHPVDAHIWRSIEEVTFAMHHDADATGTVAAAAQLPDRREVLLAALLHDIGKGHEGDHSQVGAVIAERFANRAGLDAAAARRLSDVARLHLLLPTVATRRDIADARVIRETAEQIRDARLLHLLYLVSVADARASGPDVWSPWKAQLMRGLYLRTLDLLTDRRPEEETLAILRQRAADALRGQVPEDEVFRHIDQLRPSYLLSTPPEVIGQHVALIREANGGTAARRDSLGSVDRFTLVTPDRPGILSLVAGTLAVHNASVLGGSAFTRDDGIAIEVMHVTDALGHEIDERRWARIFEAVPLALAGEFPVAERLAETRAAYRAVPRIRVPTIVNVDNVGSERYSIVEVTTADRLGLLFAITNALHSMALDIHLAKVDTIGPEVVDAFYVLRENGRRVETADEIERLQARVTQAIEALDDF